MWKDNKAFNTYMWTVTLISVKRQILTKGGGHGKIGFF